MRAAVVLDAADQLDVVVGRLGRRQEDAQAAVARLDRERGAHDAIGPAA